MSGLRRVTAGGQSGVKVYNVAGGKTLPEWLSEKKKASLRKDEEFRRRMELIQELDFPVSSSRVKLSADGNFLVVTGIHPPQVRGGGGWRRPRRPRRPCLSSRPRAPPPPRRRLRCTSCLSWR